MNTLALVVFMAGIWKGSATPHAGKVLTPREEFLLMAAYFFLGVLANALVAFGGRQVMNLRNRRSGLIAALLALAPCSYCWFLSCPLGIWALLVLARPESKAVFGE